MADLIGKVYGRWRVAMADGFTPIVTPVRGISEQVFGAGIREALAAGDTAKAERLQVLWRDYVEDRNVF